MQQREETFTDFEELSRLCVLGGEHAWLQEKREEVRIGAPFVLPRATNSHARPCNRGASRTARSSSCSPAAGPPQSTPTQKTIFLAKISEFLAFVDVAPHFGDFDLILQELNVGDREVLVNWDWSCLY